MHACVTRLLLRAEAQGNVAERDKWLKKALISYNDYVLTKPNDQLTDVERNIRRALDNASPFKRWIKAMDRAVAMKKVVNIQPYVDKRDERDWVLLVGATLVLYERANGCAPQTVEVLTQWVESIAPHYPPIDPYAVLTRAQIAKLLRDVKYGRFGDIFRCLRETNAE